MRRNCKGEIVKFTDPELLIKYLKTSEDAMYMWSDGEDFAVIADMYQVRIKNITTKGTSDETPSENWIYPDKDLKEFAELKDVKIDDMIIIHQNDVHFDLVVDKNSDLATMGSLSYRLNIPPFVEEKFKNKDSVNSVEKEFDETYENKAIKKKLKES